MDDLTKRKRHKRHKRRLDDDKKMKKYKRHGGSGSKSRRILKRSYRVSDSDSDSSPGVDYGRAVNVVRELLTETPGLAKDLLELLQMIDKGKVAVIKGINDQRFRSKLKKLFPLLGLVKLDEPKGAYSKSDKVRLEGQDSLVNVFQSMLAGDSVRYQTVATEEIQTSCTQDAQAIQDKSVQKLRKRDFPIGPSLPPAGPVGFRLAEEHVEAEMTCIAEKLEKEQWNRALTGGKNELGNNMLMREAWMTMIPENSILKDSLGPQSHSFGKIVAFRSKEPVPVDKTWLSLPSERERAKRAKLDMELLGYVREENSNAATTSGDMTLVPMQSILPIANPEADEEMRKQMENFRKSRGPSLLEQHQRKQAERGNRGVNITRSTGGWNRTRDLVARQGMSGDDAERMISAAKQINSKFTTPEIARHFL
ncbi:Protein of unknown function DUF3752 [Plasmopara halstedii]|uniref:DUF3752 domain-containing protein n=1 Tax=Plasmopara halstedii TaxID=4781 RepID=A0A0P1ATW9_PLAHL|nr:Protein of unknown function DUF3752 [Plasmopara halstedii]CEG44304.1 Protein of unknown function DUF3752 [Plasmopara halstedii]|eukprot:XP_024580673.1 Protein of unknown function DUF3752 [Plasmopara halstedii]